MFDRVLTMVENVVMVITFSTMTVLAFINVVSRYVFHGSLAWSSEIITFLGVYLFMFGTAAAIRLGAHPDFSALRDLAKGWLRAALIIVIGAAIVTFLAIFCWVSLDMLMKQAAGSRATNALAIPQWYLTLALPVGAVLGIVRAVQVTILSLRGKGPKSEAEEFIEEGGAARA